MKNESVLSGNTIENLLRALSGEKTPYPGDLLDARRAAYMSQVTLVVGSGPHFGRGNGSGQGSSVSASAPMTPVMKVVLTALVAGNIALGTYLAITAYQNWDKVQAFLLGSPMISETSPALPEVVPLPPDSANTPEIAISPEETLAPAATPDPNNLSEGSQPSDGDSTGGSDVSTSEPPGQEGPGLHLGQTPHGPDQPPSSNNQDSSQNNTQGNPDKNKNK